jgi:hypothetical protein
VNFRSEVDGHRLEGARFAGFGTGRVHAEVTAKPRRRDNGDIPSGCARQLVSQTTVCADAVRVANSQQPLPAHA